MNLKKSFVKIHKKSPGISGVEFVKFLTRAGGSKFVKVLTISHDASDGRVGWAEIASRC